MPDVILKSDAYRPCRAAAVATALIALQVKSVIAHLAMNLVSWDDIA